MHLSEQDALVIHHTVSRCCLPDMAALAQPGRLGLVVAQPCCCLHRLTWLVASNHRESVGCISSLFTWRLHARFHLQPASCMLWTPSSLVCCARQRLWSCWLHICLSPAAWQHLDRSHADGLQLSLCGDC